MSTFTLETNSSSEAFEKEIYNLAEKIANIIENIIKINDNLDNVNEAQQAIAFSNDNIPKISIINYLKRILKYTNIEKSTLILSLIYLDRIAEIQGIILSNKNIHRLLFCSVLISIKYNEDIIYDMEYYSEIAGVSIRELKLMENKYLYDIQFELFVDDNIYEKYAKYLNDFEKNIL